MLFKDTILGLVSLLVVSFHILVSNIEDTIKLGMILVLGYPVLLIFKYNKYKSNFYEFNKIR